MKKLLHTPVDLIIGLKGQVFPAANLHLEVEENLIKIRNSSEIKSLMPFQIDSKIKIRHRKKKFRGGAKPKIIILFGLSI